MYATEAAFSQCPSVHLHSPLKANTMSVIGSNMRGCMQNSQRLCCPDGLCLYAPLTKSDRPTCISFGPVKDVAEAGINLKGMCNDTCMQSQCTISRTLVGKRESIRTQLTGSKEVSKYGLKFSCYLSMTSDLHFFIFNYEQCSSFFSFFF